MAFSFDEWKKKDNGKAKPKVSAVKFDDWKTNREPTGVAKNDGRVRTFDNHLAAKEIKKVTDTPRLNRSFHVPKEIERQVEVNRDRTRFVEENKAEKHSFYTPTITKENSVQTKKNEPVQEKKKEEKASLMSRMLGNAITIKPDSPARGMFDKNNDNDTLGEKFGANLRVGSGDVLEGLAGVGRWLLPGGGKIDKDTGKIVKTDPLLSRGLQGAANKLKDGFEDEGYNKGKDFNFKKAITDPEFYATSVTRAVPQLITSIVPALGAAKLVGMIPKIKKAKTVHQTIFKALGGAGAATTIDSAIESGSVFDEAIRRGYTEEDANKAANETFMKNFALTGGTTFGEFMLGLSPIGRGVKNIGKVGSIAARTAGGAALEGFQEGAQTGISASALGDDFSWTDPSTIEAITIGTLLGGGVTGGMAVVTEGFSKAPKIENPLSDIITRTANQLPSDLRQEFDNGVSLLQQNGFDLADAQETMMEKMAVSNPAIVAMLDGSTRSYVEDQRLSQQTRADVEVATDGTVTEVQAENAVNPIAETVSSVMGGIPNATPNAAQQMQRTAPEVQNPIPAIDNAVPTLEPVVQPESLQVNPSIINNAPLEAPQAPVMDVAPQVDINTQLAPIQQPTKSNKAPAVDTSSLTDGDQVRLRGTKAESFLEVVDSSGGADITVRNQAGREYSVERSAIEEVQPSSPGGTNGLQTVEQAEAVEGDLVDVGQLSKGDIVKVGNATMEVISDSGGVNVSVRQVNGSGKARTIKRTEIKEVVQNNSSEAVATGNVKGRAKEELEAANGDSNVAYQNVQDKVDAMEDTLIAKYGDEAFFGADLKAPPGTEDNPFTQEETDAFNELINVRDTIENNESDAGIESIMEKLTDFPVASEEMVEQALRDIQYDIQLSAKFKVDANEQGKVEDIVVSLYDSLSEQLIGTKNALPEPLVKEFDHAVDAALDFEISGIGKNPIEFLLQIDHIMGQGLEIDISASIPAYTELRGMDSNNPKKVKEATGVNEVARGELPAPVEEVAAKEEPINEVAEEVAVTSEVVSEEETVETVVQDEPASSAKKEVKETEKEVSSTESLVPTELQELYDEKAEIENKITKLLPNDSYLDEVKKSFHLGTVGGSGKNNVQLNKKREQSINRAIESSKKTRPLFDELRVIENKIRSIESGEKASKDKMENRIQSNIENMEIGGKVVHGGFSQIGEVMKINAKSFRVKVEQTGNLETWPKDMITVAALPQKKVESKEKEVSSGNKGETFTDTNESINETGTTSKPKKQTTKNKKVKENSNTDTFLGTRERTDTEPTPVIDDGGDTTVMDPPPVINDDANPEHDTTVTRSDILKHISKHFDTTIDVGKTRGKKGIYKNKFAIIRTANYADFEVLAHELGHRIDTKLQLSLNPEIRDELIKFAEFNLELPESMTPMKRAREGAAEYFRQAFYNETQANVSIKDVSDELTTAINEGLEKAGWTKPTQELQAMTASWMNRTAEQELAGIVTPIGSGRRQKRSPRRMIMDVYTSLFEKEHPIWVAEQLIEKELKKKGLELPANAKAYVMAVMTRGTTARAVQFTKFNTFKTDFNRNNDEFQITGEPLEAILKDVEDSEQFGQYLVAKHAHYLKTEKGKVNTPITEEKIAEYLANTDPKIEALAQRMYDYQNRLLEVLVDGGLIDSDLPAKLKEDYPFYVPFYRDMSATGSEGSPFGSSSDGFANQQQGVKNMSEKGSSRNIINPIESIVKNTHLYFALADRNSVGVAMASWADPDSDIATEVARDLIEEVPNSFQVTDVALQQLHKTLLDVGIEQDILDGVDMAETTKIFTPMFKPNSAKNEILVWSEGKPKLYTVRDQSLYNALVQQDNQQINALMNNPVIKLAVASNKTLRFGITASPFFTVRTFVRSVFQMTVKTRAKGGNYFWQLPMIGKAMSDVVKKNDLYQEWMSSGAGQSTMIALEQNYLDRSLEGIALNKKAKNLLRGKYQHESNKSLLKLMAYIGKSAALSPLRGLQNFNDTLDQALKLSEYKVVKKQTKGNIQQAARSSRDADLDYGRFGSPFMRSMNSMTLFFNISFQGIDNVAREFANHPVRMTARGLLTVTLPTILLYLKNYDDEDYHELNSYEKDMNWMFKLEDGTFAKVPIPFELGILFKSIPEKFAGDIMDGMTGQDKQSWRDFRQNISKTMMPSFTPTILDVRAKYKAEKDTMNDWDFVPAYLKDVAAEEQYDENTSEAMKWLGKKLKKSPMVLEKTYLAQFAQAGQAALYFTDTALDATGVVDRPDTKGLKRNYLERYVTSSIDDGSTDSVSTFYDEKERLTKIKERTDEEENKLDDFKTANDYLVSLRKVRDGMLYNRLLQADGTEFPKEEKKQRIDVVNKSLRDITRLVQGKKALDEENIQIAWSMIQDYEAFEKVSNKVKAKEKKARKKERQQNR